MSLPWQVQNMYEDIYEECLAEARKNMIGYFLKPNSDTGDKNIVFEASITTAISKLFISKNVPLP